MHNSNIPADRALPSTAKLIKSTVLAAVVAGVLLVVVVMPAEYGIDPTGIGSAIGLKSMGEIKVSLAAEAAAEGEKESAAKVQPEPVLAATVASVATPPPLPTTLEHEMQVSLAPDEGAEIKVTMAKGKKVQYAWQSDAGKANFDIHGDSKALKIRYHPYSKGSEKKSEGVLEAAFDGTHGWFWRNRSGKPLTITLQTTGEYTKIQRVD